MEKNCFNCKYYDQPSFEMKEYCWECLRQEEVYTRWERKPITNADKIRAMTDEELTSFLWNRDMDILEKVSKAVGLTFRVDKKRCASNVLNWLKEEVE